MQDIIELQKEYSKSLFQKTNVVGTGVGEKFSNGKPTGIDALMVFVKEKMNGDTIGKQSADMIPEKINGIPVDVVEVGEIVKQGYNSRLRPIKPGYSCGHGDITCGTIGGFFVDKNGDHIMLSNNHVMANENKANMGDPIFQPGPMDAGRINKDWRGWKEPLDILPYIATLKDFVRINKSGNKQDSAIAIIPDTMVERGFIDTRYPHLNREMVGFGEANTKQPVQKCGRTTGYTAGRVIALHSQFTINYDFGGAIFNDCIVTTSMSKGGDSGSLIMDMDMNAVGLLFAGSTKVTIANPINEVRRHYGLKLWGQSTSKPTVTINGKIWDYFTASNCKLEIENNIVSLSGGCNQYCFMQRTLEPGVKTIVCHLNKGNDKSDDFGSGIALQFQTGILKVNAGNPHFKAFHNNNISAGVGIVKPDGNYGLRIRLTDSIIYLEGYDNGWFTVLELPRGLYPGDPTLVKIGKMDHKCEQNNGKNIGSMGHCRITKIKIS
jgi:hypothetical protein